MTSYELLTLEKSARARLKRGTFALLTASFALNLLLASTVLLRGETVTTVLLPLQAPASDRPLTVREGATSSEYLTLVARDFLNLAMNLTPENADFNRKVFLSHVLPESFHALDVALSEVAAELKRLRATTFFAMDAMTVAPETLTVTARGYRTHFIGGKETQRKRVTVTLVLVQIAGRLYVKSLTVEDSQ